MVNIGQNVTSKIHLPWRFTHLTNDRLDACFNAIQIRSIGQFQHKGVFQPFGFRHHDLSSVTSLSQKQEQVPSVQSTLDEFGLKCI